MYPSVGQIRCSRFLAKPKLFRWRFLHCWAAFILLALIMVLQCNLAFAQPDTSSPTAASFPRISAETATHQLVCNASSAFAQIPGQTDFFVGRGMCIGSLDYCHQVHPEKRAFLALFRMDWKSNKMIFQRKLLAPPDKPAPGIKTPSGVSIDGCIDPSMVDFHGEKWIAFEGTTMGTNCSCVVPLTPDFTELDLSRLTVAVKGVNGPIGKGGVKAGNNTMHAGPNQIVCLHSCSTPWLLNFQGHLYIYWTDDSFLNDQPDYPIVSRGMELVEDDQGRLWGKGSGGRPVNSNDPNLTCTLRYPDKSDPASNHVAHLRSAYVFGDKILTFFTLGGDIGNQVCCSPHQTNPGCWRPVIAIANRPLGDNAFGQATADVPSLPCNKIEYPRFILDPSGRKLLLGQFAALTKTPGGNEGQIVIPDGVTYIPADSIIGEALYGHKIPKGR
jgi:hypothetical protein